MRVIYARNVNDALLKGLDLFQSTHNYYVQETRNGTAYEVKEPVTTAYLNPWERVCLHEERDANPFFHFIESLWMLAGRKDLAPLTYFVKSMADFSDDGETLWGAYGWRWQSYFGRDQLPLIIEMLKKNPNDRRAVLQMWDSIKDLGREGKDVPCNTNIYFKVREGSLNMTVCCRSNDAVWGAYGANVVHMSILQEYMATMIGVDIGTYRQISDSFHVYTNAPVWNKVKDLKIDPYNYPHLYKNPYDNLEGYIKTPLITNKTSFHWELDRFFNTHPNDIDNQGWENPAFKEIAVPMTMVYAKHKQKDHKAVYELLTQIKPMDWKTACFNWIRKRDKNYDNAEQGGKDE